MQILGLLKLYEHSPGDYEVMNIVRKKMSAGGYNLFIEKLLAFALSPKERLQTDIIASLNSAKDMLNEVLSLGADGKIDDPLQNAARNALNQIQRVYANVQGGSVNPNTEILANVLMEPVEGNKGEPLDLVSNNKLENYYGRLFGSLERMAGGLLPSYFVGINANQEIRIANQMVSRAGGQQADKMGALINVPEISNFIDSDNKVNLTGLTITGIASKLQEQLISREDKGEFFKALGVEDNFQAAKKLLEGGINTTEKISFAVFLVTYGLVKNSDEMFKEIWNVKNDQNGSLPQVIYERKTDIIASAIFGPDTDSQKKDLEAVLAKVEPLAKKVKASDDLKKI